LLQDQHHSILHTTAIQTATAIYVTAIGAKAGFSTDVRDDRGTTVHLEGGRNAAAEGLGQPDRWQTQFRARALAWVAWQNR
jgi:hypothetical protein